MSLAGAGRRRRPRSWIYRLGANPEWRRAASCRPIRSWPLSRRWGRFPPVALPSAQVISHCTFPIPGVCNHE
jgi:hypothetical protein